MQADKNTVSRLLKNARGQIEAVLKMVEDDRYCIDISNQILAAQALLKKANKEVLAAHIRCCVKNAVDSGDDEEKINEIVRLIEKAGK